MPVRVLAALVPALRARPAKQSDIDFDNAGFGPRYFFAGPGPLIFADMDKSAPLCPDAILLLTR